MDRSYIAIDLKSFYASAECRDLGVDPLDALLVVADESRTEKTICLAVSPALKAYHIPGRARLFEVVEAVRTANAFRRQNAPGHRFTGKSASARELAAHPELEIDFRIACPRMARYMELSTQIYGIYLRYIAPEDIHVYSVDEVFIDCTDYLRALRLTPHELAIRMIRDVLHETGITATAGIGTNLYLAKVAMDIVAKKMPADADGVRIAELDEQSYRRQLWEHTPLTDFWRVGPGYAKKLDSVGLHTMGDVARCSIGDGLAYYNEDLLYRLFGVNAELLIDHAWGYEPCRISDIKAYRPENNSISSGQVLQEPYPFEKALLVTREMTDSLTLSLVEKDLVTTRMDLTVVYDTDNLSDPQIAARYHGPVEQDRYGRKMPKAAHGFQDLDGPCSSSREIMEAVVAIFRREVNPDLLVRRIYVVAEQVIPAEQAAMATATEQLSLFSDVEAEDAARAARDQGRARERAQQDAVLAIRKKFGSNAIVRGMNLQEGATGMDRNGQIGGHKA